MKKYLLSILGLFVCFLAVAGDACFDNYLEAKKLYDAGRYAEAQVKFIAVAQICGDYHDVYTYIRNCNSRMVSDANSKQKQLETTKASLTSKTVEAQSMTEQIKKLKVQLKEKQDSLDASKNEVKSLIGAVNFAKLNKQKYADSLSVSMNNVDSLSILVKTLTEKVSQLSKELEDRKRVSKKEQPQQDAKTMENVSMVVDSIGGKSKNKVDPHHGNVKENQEVLNQGKNVPHTKK